MKKEIYLSIIPLFLILVIGVVSAQSQTCTPPEQPKSYSQLISGVAAYDSALKACSPAVPSQLKMVLKNGVLFVNVTDGEKLAVNVSNGLITGISLGEPASYAYRVNIPKCMLDVILSKGNSVGAFAAYYLSGNAQLGARGFFNRLKLWIGRPFLRAGLKKVQTTDVNLECAKSSSGKPENCFETYMQGHKEYQFGKENWDRWLNETGNICQTQTAERPKGGNCVYLYEQIQGNDKKWLCWYK